ncbi:DUF6879 family protein [Actinoplanes sp. NPDC051343]|uniref:DUF6879 family protein n=1 Tax=Actinoplanes sp. NPDC051343 TaxID=3363906 RepID=UPI0037938A2C
MPSAPQTVPLSGHPSLFRGVFLTVGPAVVTFLVVRALNQPLATAIMLSILIGSLALLVRLLINFEMRLHAVETLQQTGSEEMRHLVGTAFSEISEATELFGLIEASAVQTDLVTQLVRNSTRITPSSPPIVYQFVQSKIKEMSDFLKELAEGGAVTYYGEDREWLLGLTRNAAESIDAISLAAVDHDLWQSEIGRRYLDAQRQVARTGRRVRRIFVLDRPEAEHDPALRRVYDEQRRMLIDVRLLDRSAVPGPLQIQVRDLIVFDDAVAYETTPTTSDPEQAQVAETRLVLTTSRVKECAQLFRELWDISRDLGDSPFAPDSI